LRGTAVGQVLLSVFNTFDAFACADFFSSAGDSGGGQGVPTGCGAMARVGCV
jgi:hypothetical protein